MTAKSTVFLREATGLVRSYTWYDALVLSLAVTGPTLFGMSSQIGYVAPAGPGADFVISALIGLLFMIPLAVVYYVFSVQMPRSGADYIWIGRSLNPLLGFVGGWVMYFSFVALLAAASATEPLVVIPDVLVAWGYVWNNPGLVTLGQNFASSTTNLFIFTLLTVGIGMLIASLTPRIYSRIMVALATIIFLATFIFIGALAAATPSSFAAGLSSLTSGSVTVNGTITQAQQAGFSYVPVNSVATWLAVPYGVLLFNGFNYSTYVSGEVRNVKSGMMWGVVIALAICGTLDSVGIYFAMRAETYPFVQAAFALFGAGKFSLGVSPWSPVFIPAVLSNPYLSSFVELGFLLFNFWWAAGLALAASRYVFAFSFDRVLPTIFADVNDRLHVPLKAMGLTFVIAIFITWVVSFTPYYGQLLNTTTIWTIVWILVGISGIVLPFYRKTLAANLPGGRWLLPIFSVLTIIGMGTTFFWSVTNPNIGPSSPSSMALLGIMFGSGVVIYLARYFYFKGKGIDLILSQREIPPE
ncbi:MAG TPA: APC family permease [Candidatus Acidoferrales bacterium]|nr:APC family permease [Candidatus Acidoferrales bacterium]